MTHVAVTTLSAEPAHALAEAIAADGRLGRLPLDLSEVEPGVWQVAKSVIGGTSDYRPGERVFHQEFGYGRVAAIDSNKLTIDFDKAGQKRVLDSFVERH